MSVFIGSIPNNDKDDIQLAKDIVKGNISCEGDLTTLKKKLEGIFNSKPFLFNRGRDSLYFFLRLLNLNSTDEILLQAFTCIAVVSPIIWTKAKPVYIDIKKESFNMNLDSLKKKITSNTRAIIVQHTFGNIIDTQKVREIVEKENRRRETNRKIYLIEDCAHIFTEDFSKLGIGKYSDMYFFSFSQDKSISSTQGALMIINNPTLLKKATLEYQNIQEPNKKEALYNAKYILLWSNIKRNYFKTLIPFTNITIGRILIIVYRMLGLIRKQAGTNTVEGAKIEKMSDIQACLLLNQLKKSNLFNKHREDIVNIYNKYLDKEYRYTSNTKFLLRYPILLQNTQEIKRRLLELKLISGNWYKNPVHPLTYESKKLTDVNYIVGSCPNAEFLGKQVLNLPTNIEMTSEIAIKVSKIINKFARPLKF